MELSNYVNRNEAADSTIYNNITNGSPKDSGHVLHWHPHYEFMIVYKSSTYTLTNNSKKIVSNRPAIYIHRPYTLHLIVTHEDSVYERSIIRFGKKFFSYFSRDLIDFSPLTDADLTCVYPNPAEMAQIHALTDIIHNTEHRKHDKVLMYLQIAQLLHMISDILESGRGERFSGALSYIQDVILLAAENLASPPTIRELADRFNIGQSKFCSDFKRHTGSTYKKYLTDLRMARARDLLLSGSSIINASLETGYSSEAHFIKTFHSYYGVTPGALRK